MEFPAVKLIPREPRATLTVFANPMNIVAPEVMKYAMFDEFLIADLGAVDIKGMGRMDLINVSLRLVVSRSGRMP